MRPADRVALLTALMEATDLELKRAKQEALQVSEQVGVKSFATPFGNVTVGQKSAKPAVKNPTALFEYVKHNHPTEIEVVRQVRSSFVTALLNRVEWDTTLGEFIDTETGEAIPGLDWTEPGDPYITWPSGDEQKRTKAEAQTWFREKADTVLAGMLAIEQKQEAS